MILYYNMAFKIGRRGVISKGKWEWLADNIAMGFTPVNNIELKEFELYEDAEHYINLLRPFRYIHDTYEEGAEYHIQPI